MNSLLRFVLLLACVAAPACLTCSAATSAWTDLQGTSFKGEPRGIYGPFALFKTGTAKGRRILLRYLSPEDCVRFYRETEAAQKFGRASDWSNAKSDVSIDLSNRLLRLEKDRLLRMPLEGKAEPELYVCFFASGWEGPSYQQATWYRAAYERLRRLYGNDMETVYLGVRHDSNEGFARNTRMPWLTVEYGARTSIDVYRHYAPPEGAGMVLLHRSGVPLVATAVSDLQSMKRFVDDLCGIMGAADPQNMLFWKDRAHYLAAVRPVQFAQGSAPALLVGNPLRPSALRKNGVQRVAAKLEIDAGGNVTSATIVHKDGLKASLVTALEKSLRNQFLFLPAIEQGTPVASSYDLDYNVPEVAPAQEADRDWVVLSGRKEIALPTWLLLRPIPVPQEDFSQVENVGADGTATMAAVEVGKEAVSKRAQMNAFNSDFFPAGEAGNVKPVEGETVEVLGQTLRWERYDSKDGLVEMRQQQNVDYCVGYAWSEFESPKGGPVYLGLGSDDGVKIWLNGTLVHDRWVVRPTQVDQVIVPLHLSPGRNTILVKIQNRKDDWSFLFRLRQ